MEDRGARCPRSTSAHIGGHHVNRVHKRPRLSRSWKSMKNTKIEGLAPCTPTPCINLIDKFWLYRSNAMAMVFMA